MKMDLYEDLILKLPLLATSVVMYELLVEYSEAGAGKYFGLEVILGTRNGMEGHNA